MKMQKYKANELIIILIILTSTMGIYRTLQEVNCAKKRMEIELNRAHNLRGMSKHNTRKCKEM